MSAPRLPENLNEWPDDPYAILGVHYGIDPRELRRAYTQLIRTYKPEQFPEHFRRIREAYETVLRHAPFFGKTAASSEPPEPVAAEPAPAALERGPDLLEQMQSLWELACRGQESEAYRGLRLLAEQHPASDELRMRLYWLLRLTPEIDSLRQPIDWLLPRLRANGFTGPLRELYRRELAENPEQVGDDSATDLLLHLAGSSGVLDLAGWRWLAAARLKCWDWIIADVEALRDLVSRDSPERWVCLLASAVDFLAWGRTRAARRKTARYCAEAQSYEELQLRLGREFDRLEHCQMLAEAWHSLKDAGELPAAVGKLLAVCWGRPEADVHPRLEAFLAAVAREPRSWLETLTELHAEAPGLTDLVLRTLQSQPAAVQGNASLRREAEDARQAIADFLDLQGKRSYDIFRRALLDFCLAEAIPPEAVADHVEGRKDYWLNRELHLAQVLTADVPLLCVWLAHRLFCA